MSRPAHIVDVKHESRVRSAIAPLVAGDWMRAGIMLFRHAGPEPLSLAALQRAIAAQGSLYAGPSQSYLSEIRTAVRAMLRAGVDERKVPGCPLRFVVQAARSYRDGEIDAAEFRLLLRYRHAFRYSDHPSGNDIFDIPDAEKVGRLLNAARASRLIAI